MPPLAWLLVVSAAALSAGNVVAVWLDLRRLEYFCKPLVMVALISVALLLHPHHEAQRWFWVVALALGLASDVFLMLPQDLFLAGLVAALLEHLVYIAGFRFGGFAIIGAFTGLVMCAVAAALLLPRILRALVVSGMQKLGGPVIAYVVVISLMTVSATGSGSLVAAAGGVLFFASDALLAWYRFIAPFGWGRPVNIATYQAGQALLVLSLAL